MEIESCGEQLVTTKIPSSNNLVLTCQQIEGKAGKNLMISISENLKNWVKQLININSKKRWFKDGIEEKGGIRTKFYAHLFGEGKNTEDIIIDSKIAEKMLMCIIDIEKDVALF